MVLVQILANDVRNLVDFWAVTMMITYVFLHGRVLAFGLMVGIVCCLADSVTSQLVKSFGK